MQMYARNKHKEQIPNSASEGGGRGCVLKTGESFVRKVEGILEKLLNCICLSLPFRS